MLQENLDCIIREPQYTQHHLEALRQQEECLRYSRFGSREALELGEAVIKLSGEYDREIGVRITRESDEMVLFQYMMDQKSQRNISFMEGKRAAALASGHCSLCPYVENKLNGRWQKLFEQTPEYLPYAGAFGGCTPPLGGGQS